MIAGRLFRSPTRRARFPLTLTACLLAVLMPGRVFAQTTSLDDESPLPTWEIGPYLGIARDSPVGTNWGVTPDRDHIFVGLRASATVLRWRRWSFRYTPEIVPLLLLSNNPRYRTQTVATGAGPRPVVTEDGRGYVAGFALVPFGWRTIFASLRGWAPTAEGR